MKVNKIEFITSAFSQKDFPNNNLPEFAFSGRSNVGKSSLINTLLNRKNVAHTSSTPGRTQSINFFNIDDKLFFVDLPGYGFARVPENVKKSWGDLINGYLYNRPNLAGIIQIVDARHKPTTDDRIMVNWLKATNLPSLIVATKVDKISRGQRNKQEKLIRDTLLIDSSNLEFAYFSAQTGEGKDRVSGFILEHV